MSESNDADRGHALLDPPPEAIMVGYMLMKARRYVFDEKVIERDGEKYTVAEYLWDAHQCAREAAPKVAEQSGMYYMQPEPGLRMIMEAMAGMHKIGEAHDFFRKMMADLGYRPITDRDFAALGAGGGR